MSQLSAQPPARPFAVIQLRAIRMTAALVIGLLVAVSWPPGPRADAAPQTTFSLWTKAKEPAVTAADDREAVVLGTVFTPKFSGSISGMRFYKGAGNGGTHVGRLWDANGLRLASVRFTRESATGWQYATFPTAVKVIKGARYTVSYTAPRGRYAADQGVFLDGRKRNARALTGLSGVFTYGSGRPTRTWEGTSYYVDVLFKPTDPSKVPPAGRPAASAFPSAATTGVPRGTTLSPYQGPCTITRNNSVIDKKTVTCDLQIRAAGVKITRSLIRGSVATDENSTGFSFAISDSRVIAGDRPVTGVGSRDFTAIRVHVTGGNRSMHCWSRCTIKDSYVHGQYTDRTGTAHESGIRMGQGAVLRHNTIACDAPDVPPDAGCSAALTGYGDFAPVRDNLVQGNLIKATTGGFCAYGGSSDGKPFSAETRRIRFVDNVFERGHGRKCGYWGPITSFDASLPGNVWRGNVWSDGGAVLPAN